MNRQEFLERYAQLGAAREEYLERMKALSLLGGAEFDSAAEDLSAWVAETNERLNDFARSELGEALAVDAESLAMLVMSRNAPEVDPT